jgi:DNA-binding transcriptional regulator YhcF (GntR family)
MLMRAAQSLTEQLAERFAARIRDRLLAPGSRLPSVRQCATQHQLSPSTVVAAYDQLLAQGLIERGRSGAFLSGIGRQNRHFPAPMGHHLLSKQEFRARRPGWRGWRRRSTPRR